MARGKSPSNGASLGFEATLWAAANKLIGMMDASEYKHVVLGLIFLKYVSDSFEELHQELIEDPEADAEDQDEYTAKNVFWIQKQARWSYIQANAVQPTIGRILDEAMESIEKDNRSLKGVLPKDYTRYYTTLKEKLGELVNLIGTIGLGDKENRSKDILGRVYEYFLTQFASAEGKKAGQFFTPRCVVQLIVEMLAPEKNTRVFDPACGSGGFFVQSEKFIESHAGNIGDIAVFGQESNTTTWRLAKMNLAIRGVSVNLGPEPGDSFLNDLHPSLKADYVMANPPFNMKDWGQPQLQNDVRWKYGLPPANNANFAWVQHFIHHLAPNGMAGYVLANGSMASNTSGEGEIRRSIVEDDLVDCMVALPSQLFYSAQIPVCLWFLARNKADPRYRDRRGETLFIDARKLGVMVDRVHRELTSEDIIRICETYHSWREGSVKTYAEISGFCKSVTLDNIAKEDFILTPGRYVGAEDIEDDGEDLTVRMIQLSAKLKEQVSDSMRLSDEIFANLKALGYGD